MSARSLLSDLRHRPRLVFTAAWALVISFRLVLWAVYMRLVPFTGDEVFYTRGARTIHRWMRGVQSWDAVAERVLGKGWFMPGITVHILPARRLTADVGLLRLWLGAVDLVLLAVLVVLVIRVLGRKVALGGLLVIGLMPDQAAQSFSVWGEAHGGKVLLIASLALLITIDRSRRWPRWSVALAFAGCGLLFGWAIYLRPPFLLQVGTAVVVVIVLVLGRRAAAAAQPWTTVAMGATLIPVFALALVAPWSIALTEDSGGFVLTTNTVNVNLIQAFSDPEDLETLMGGNTFGELESYIRRRMVEKDETYVEALANTRSELFESVTLGEYLERADREITSYLDVTDSFLVRYGTLRKAEIEAGREPPPAWGNDLLRAANAGFWAVIAAASLYAVVTPFTLTSGLGFHGLFAKIAIPAAAIQPWVSNAKFRHLGAILPLLTIVALAAVFDRTRASPDDNFRPGAQRFARIVHFLSAAMILTTAIIAVT